MKSVTAALIPKKEFRERRPRDENMPVCDGRACYTLEQAMARAVMSERCPRCGWFHILRAWHTPESGRELKTR